MNTKEFKLLCEKEQITFESLDEILRVVFSFIFWEQRKKLDDIHFDINTKVGIFKILERQSQKDAMGLIINPKLIVLAKISLASLIKVSKGNSNPLSEFSNYIPNNNFNRLSEELFRLIKTTCSKLEKEHILILEAESLISDSTEEALNNLYSQSNDLEVSEFNDFEQLENDSWVLEDGPFCSACEQRPCMCSDPDPG